MEREVPVQNVPAERTETADPDDAIVFAKCVGRRRQRKVDDRVVEGRIETTAGRVDNEVRRHPSERLKRLPSQMSEVLEHFALAERVPPEMRHTDDELVADDDRRR